MFPQIIGRCPGGPKLSLLNLFNEIISLDFFVKYLSPEKDFRHA
ncbi:hypothetical protein C8D70_1251, partial [Chryseobacterium sp. CBTAP 102]